MSPTSYTLKARNLPYVFLVMFLIVFMIASLMYLSVMSNFTLVILVFALLAVIMLFVITIVILKKSLAPQLHKGYEL